MFFLSYERVALLTVLEKKLVQSSLNLVFTNTPGVRDIFKFARGIKLSLHKKSPKGNLGSEL